MPYQKGKSGNPNGRPKGAKTHKTLLREQLFSKALGDSDLIEIIKSMGEMAKQGDAQAAKLLFEYHFGKPTQELDHHISGVTDIEFIINPPSGVTSA